MSRVLKVLTSPWGDGTFIALVLILAALLFVWQNREVDLRVKQTQRTLDDQAAAWSDLLQVRFMAFDELLSLPDGLSQAEGVRLLKRRLEFWDTTSGNKGLVSRLIGVTTSGIPPDQPHIQKVEVIELNSEQRPLPGNELEALAHRGVTELRNAEGALRLHTLFWESDHICLTVWRSDNDFYIVDFNATLFFKHFLQDTTDSVFPNGGGAPPDFVPAVVEGNANRRILFRQVTTPSHGPTWGNYPLVEADIASTLNPIQDPAFISKLKDLKLAYSYFLERSIRGTRMANVAQPQSDLAFTYLLTHGTIEELILLQSLPVFVLGYLALLLLGAALLTVSRYGRQMRELLVRQEEFVSTTTHELRTPLHIISNGADNLAEGIIFSPVDVRNYGEILRTEAERLSRMVEGILTYAGVGRQAPVEVAFEVDPLVDEILKPYRILCRETAIELVVETTPGLRFIGDPEAVKLVLSNLLSNAVHHASSGRWIRVEVCHSSGLSLRVQDRGPGLTRKEISQLSESFLSVVSPKGSGRFGHGLGLSIVQRIVKTSGGDLLISRHPDGGCDFQVRLPYRKQE